MLSSGAITQRVRSVIAEVGAVDAASVTGSARLTDDLSFDSLRLVELALSLESEFAIGEVEETTVLDIITVADVERLILELLGAGT